MRCVPWERRTSSGKQHERVIVIHEKTADNLGVRRSLCGQGQLGERSDAYRFLLEPERGESKGVHKYFVGLLHHRVGRLRVPHVDAKER